MSMASPNGRPRSISGALRRRQEEVDVGVLTAPGCFTHSAASEDSPIASRLDSLPGLSSGRGHGQPKVNDLDSGGPPTNQHDVIRFQVSVEDGDASQSLQSLKQLQDTR